MVWELRGFIYTSVKNSNSSEKMESQTNLESKSFFKGHNIFFYNHPT